MEAFPKLWIMVLIGAGVSSSEGDIDLTSGVLLLVLPIPIGWTFTLLLQARLKTDFWLVSTKGQADPSPINDLGHPPCEENGGTRPEAQRDGNLLCTSSCWTQPRRNVCSSGGNS